MRMLRSLFLLVLSGAALAQAPYRPAQHTQPPPFFGAIPPDLAAAYADLGVQIERDRPPASALAEHRRLERALATLRPQRPGTVDAYVVAVALDSDPVFGREAREAGRVLARRYGSEGRSVTLAGTDGVGESDLPMGSPGALAAVLARVAELMDVAEDVLILYTTSHGAPIGIVYNDGDRGFGAISPARLFRMLRELGIERRLLLVSACYSGAFVPMMSGDGTAIVTASAADRTSFGCQADSDWTFFGDALVNHALRKPQPLARAAEEAQRSIAGWEREGKLDPSDPQVSIGRGARAWLARLEARLPPGGPPVGRPATTILAQRR
jgi:hypothetical protein